MLAARPQRGCLLRANLLACADLLVWGRVRYACVSNKQPCFHGAASAAASVLAREQTVAWDLKLYVSRVGVLFRLTSCIEFCMGVCAGNI
jgi:hypothetical protein